jgi:hypothetical protein
MMYIEPLNLIHSIREVAMKLITKYLRKAIYIAISLGVLILLLLAGCATVGDQDAQAAFEARKQPISVTVYPVNIVLGEKISHDRDLSRRLVTFLQDEGLADPVLGSVNHSYPFKWGMNQAKMFARSADAFGYQVRNDKIETDYALLVEILCWGSESGIGGVEYYLVDKDGKVASASLCNSDWAEFQEVKPGNRNGGIDLAIKMLRRDWKVR